MKSKEIVLVKETRQKEYVRKLMDAISPYLHLKPSDKVAIKVTLPGSREIYANTSYSTVEALMFYLKDHFGVSDISVLEGSDAAYFSGKSTWDIFYKFKYKGVELNGGKLVNLDELTHENHLEVQTLAGPKKVAYTQYETDYLISLVPPKTHNIWTVGLGIPNLIGFVKPEDRCLVYGTTNVDLKKVNTLRHDKFKLLQNFSGKNFSALLNQVEPSLSIIDGLYGMEGKGPVKGSPVFHGFTIASEDLVLADALTTFVMGFDSERISYITAAHEDGLGEKRWNNVTGVDPAQVKFPYRPHPAFQSHKPYKKNTHGKFGNDRYKGNKNYNRENRHKDSHSGGYNKNNHHKGQDSERFSKDSKKYERDNH